MILQLKLNTSINKRIIRVVIALAVAWLVQYYYPHHNIHRDASFDQSGQNYWIVLIAFVISQAGDTIFLRQSILFVFISVIGLFISALISHTTSQIQIHILALIYIGVGSYLVMIELIPWKQFVLFAFFLLVILFATLVPIFSPEFIGYRLIDIAIGGLIGILCTAFIFPISTPEAFRQGLVPTLEASIQYIDVMLTTIEHQETKRLAKTKWLVENALQMQKGNYPEWVYEKGFNPGLRAGFRFFLIYLERVIETLFSIDHLLNTNITLPKTLSAAVKHALLRNRELLTILSVYFKKNILTEVPIDLTSDITALEKSLNEIVPSSLELLDVSPEYISYTELVRDIKDMRKLLLQLLNSLPKTGN